MKSSGVASPKANLSEAAVESKNWVAISATAAVVLVGASTLVYSYFKSKAEKRIAEKLYRKPNKQKAA